MYVDPHDLPHEFPEFVQAIEELRNGNQQFRRLFDDYNRANDAVVNAEQADIPMSDFAFEELKKMRLRLKDEIYRLLRAHAGYG
ncbi:MAG: YdcH family protein [Betaproteobacteria bacterium]|nr:YdcH family protein [Betaproteobacteria bacterium]